SLAIGRLFRAISEQNEADLKSYTGELLHKRILKELQGVQASGHTLHVYVPRVHDCVVTDAWMWAGKHATFEEAMAADGAASATSSGAGEHAAQGAPMSKIIELATIFIGLDRHPTADTAQDLVKSALKDSAKFRIDVEVDLELHWRVTRAPTGPTIASSIIADADTHAPTKGQGASRGADAHAGEHGQADAFATEGLVAEGGCRRRLAISFDTPWFRPAAQIMQRWGKEDQPSSWQWKISDVDFLLREESLAQHQLPHN
ncbi:hypothetical protein SYNPS1DRAFT_21478, partial [Syncephalis pseudoplumigaleata]